MKISAKQLASHLRSKLAPCYLITGDEHLLVAEALHTLREAARARGFTSHDRQIANPGFDWMSLRESGRALSLFSNKRWLELRLPTGKPGRTGGEVIAELAQAAISDLLFVVVAPKLDRSAAASKWAKSLDAAGVTVQIWPVERRELPAWIRRRMQAVGLQPDTDAVALIADRVEGNLLAAAQEVEKLRLVLGETSVTEADVRSAVADSSRYDVYKLVDSALAGEAKRALKILAGLRAEGLDPVIVVWALTRELRTLARLENKTSRGVPLSDAMSQAGVWRSRQALVRNAVARQPIGACQRLLQSCACADLAAKGQSGEDAWQVATDILLGLAFGERQAA